VVRGYSLLQLRLFTEAAVRARRRELAELAIAARSAQYDKKGFRDHLRGLTDG
jgi:hypothetical protein